MWKWLADHIIAVVIAGVLVGVLVPLINGALDSKKNVPSKSDDGKKVVKKIDSPIYDPNRDSVHVHNFDSLYIDWTNVSEYFTISKISVNKGFKKAKSELKFVLTAKGAFRGILDAFAFDQDNVKIYEKFWGERSSHLTPMFEDNMFKDDILQDIDIEIFDIFNEKDPRLRSWDQGESQRVMIFFPHNAAKLQIVFSQKS